ncbi:MAG: hypothetical protein ACRD2Z_09450 [Thermoanaerobaculia bacterium]
MEYSREAIAAQLAEARGGIDQAEAELHAAKALDEATSRPGLRYAALGPDQSSYVVACNGTVIGQIWRGKAGHALGDWTAARLGSTDRLGPFGTSRAAAAALAHACGVSPAPAITEMQRTRPGDQAKRP